MKAFSSQRGFVVPQFIWVSFAFVLVMLLFIDFAPSDAMFSGGLAKAKNAQTGVRSVAAKSSSYFSDTAQQPESIADLLSNRRQLSGWNGPYITEQQKKDPWGYDYIIRTPGLHGALDVISLGADGLVGGTEKNSDIGNWESK